MQLGRFFVPEEDAVFSVFVCDKMGVGTLGTMTAKLGTSQVIAGAVESDISPIGKFSVKVPRAILQQYAGQQVTFSVSVVGNGYPRADKSITLSVTEGGWSIQLPTLDESTIITVLVAVAVALLLGGAMVLMSRRMS